MPGGLGPVTNPDQMRGRSDRRVNQAEGTGFEAKTPARVSTASNQLSSSALRKPAAIYTRFSSASLSRRCCPGRTERGRLTGP